MLEKEKSKTRNSLLPSQNIFPIILAIAFTVSIIILDLWRLESWRATGMDMAWYSQALWLIGQGHWKAYDTMVGYPALADSASYILYPVGLLYRFIGQPGILVLQGLAVSSGFVGLWYYFNKYQMNIRDRIGWILLFAVYPAVIGSAIFDWHPDVMMIPAFFLSIWAFEERRVGLFVLGLIVASATKDVGAAVTAVFGVGLLFQRQWKYAGYALLIGAGTVLLDFLVVLPWIDPHGVVVWQATYGWLGSSPMKAVLNVSFHPDILLKAWTRPDVLISWMISLVGFGIVLPIVGGFRTPYGLPILAVFAFNGLSGFGPQIYPWHQYWLPAVPFLFAASLTVWTSISLRSKWLMPIVMTALLLGIFSMAKGQLVSFHQPYVGTLNRISRKIPDNAPVIGMNEDLALLANRSYVSLISARDLLTSPLGTYAFMDMNDMSNELTSPANLHSWLHILDTNRQWSLVAHQHNIWLFRKVKGR